MLDRHAQLYATVAGAENCAHRLLNNAHEMIRNQGDNDKTRELLDKQLLLMNAAMAMMLAYRETLSLPQEEVAHE